MLENQSQIAISHDDFQSWLHNPVTQRFLQDTVDAMDSQLAQLISSAGLDNLKDRWVAGFIYGLRQLADWQPDLIKEEVEIDGIDS